MHFGTKGQPSVRLFRLWLDRHNELRALAACASTTVLWQWYHEQARAALDEAHRWAG